MEGLFVWVLLFAGGALFFLGFLLVASEKEVKARRREVEALLAKLESISAGAAPPIAAPEHELSAELNELRARNQQLQHQTATTERELELSRRTIQDLQAEQTNASSSAELQQLRAENDRLQMQLVEFQSRLTASEAQLRSSAAALNTSQNSQQSENEIAILQEKLYQSQSRIRELEIVQQNLPNLQEVEFRHREERQRLEAHISGLNKTLSENQERLSELDVLHARLAESEREQHRLQDEIQRREQEVSEWQAQITEAEEHRRRLAALQKPYSELLSKHASLAQKQREIQSDLEALARLVGNSSAEAMLGRANESSFASPGESSGVSPASAQSAALAGAQDQVAVEPGSAKSRRFGVVSVVLVSLALGGVASIYFGSPTSESKAPSIPAKKQASVVEPAVASAPSSAAIARMESQPMPPLANVVRPAVQEPSEAALHPKPVRREEAYEITRASQVYAAPTELSQSLGEIQPGMKVSVVNSQNGWLEIHSKHGRPPGFIRKEVAIRVAQN